MLVALILAGSNAYAQDAAAPIQAVATLEARSGSKMTGTVTFLQSGGAGAAPGTDTHGTMPGTGQHGTAPSTATPDMGRPGTGAPGAPGTDQPALGDRLGQSDMPDKAGNERITPTPAMGGNQVQVSIRLVNATPGNHAVFLHENGDCSAPDASSAGNFYAGMPSTGATTSPPPRAGSLSAPSPTTETPGTGTPGTGTPGTGTPGTGEGLAGPPAGYIGFVTVGAEGRGEKDIVLTNYTLAEGQGSILNRAVVVYEKAPDFTAGGDPGARQACGVIQKRTAPLGTE